MGKSKQRKTNEKNIRTTGTQLGRARRGLEQAGDAFTNTASGITGASYSPTDAEGATLGDPTLAKLGTLDAAQGYTAERATAAQADRVNLGEQTGFQNQYANLQVSTAKSDAQARDAERSLASTLESGAVTGASGATALAQAAAGAKEGIRGDIGQQEAQNAQLRAQGATDVQQAGLQQRNLSRQSDISQGQFNVGLQQQTALANQQAGNQAAQFGAQAQNQFSLASFDAQNQLSQFNAGAQNQFAQSRFGAANQFSLANAASQNQAAQFGAESGFQAQQLQAQGEAARQQNAYNAEANLYSQDAAQAQAANQAEADRKAANKALFGQIVGGALGAVGTAAGGGAFKKAASDPRLKENIERVGESPSGIPIYEFDYIDKVYGDGRYRGTMSNEIPEFAVAENAYGAYDGVYYDLIDVDFIKL